MAQLMPLPSLFLASVKSRLGVVVVVFVEIIRN